MDSEKSLDRFLLDQWEMAEGIPSNSILAIAQTPDGYLWIATGKNLVRFDGMKFSIFDFTGSPATDTGKETIPDTLFVDREGTLWIGSSLGLTSYRFQSRQFKTLTSADGITIDRVRRIKDDMKGNLWICFYSSYVNRYFNGEFTAFNASHGLVGKKINAIVEDKKGNLIFGSRENGVFLYKDETFSSYPIAGLDNVNIISMHEDSKGELWIGTNNGLFRVSGAGTQKYTTRDGLSNDYITYITEDSDLNLWVGTVKGLNRLKKTRGSDIAVEHILERFTISYLFEDLEKSLWIGTYSSGLKRLKEGKFIAYAPMQKQPAEIHFSLMEDKHGDTWIGTLSGKLFHFRGGDLLESVMSPELSDIGIAAIAEDTEGNLWLGTTGKGVYQRKSSGMTRFTTGQGLTDNLVSSITCDSQGNIWLSTFDGVTVIRCRDNKIPNNPVIEAFNAKNGLSGKRVHNVYEDKNKNIWIAADKGITVLKDGMITKENTTYYLQGFPVTCIHEDLPASGPDNRTGRVYWLATHGAGLKRLELPGGSVYSYTTAEGMITNFLYQFFEDHEENFWFMSDSGIIRVSKRELNQLTGGNLEMINCISFGLSDGMKSLEFNNEFSRHSALRLKNGEFWFITKEGISIINPDKVWINKIPPPVVIEDVLFNENPIAFNQESGTNEFKGITEILFRFTAPTFLSPEKIKFKYRLEDFDEEWVYLPAGSVREARYKDLAPGSYTFRVIACNAEGVWNRTGTSMTFSLKPFFYQTLLFKISALFFLMALAAAGFFIYNGIKKRAVDKNKKQEKYKTSQLSPQFVEVSIEKLKNLMDNEKIYQDSGLTVSSLAERMSIPSHVLSQILNEQLNQNFADFVNSYRIEAAKRIFSGRAEQKITNVAFDVGFNTIVAFYNAFKKYTGMTPAQFKKEVGKKK